MANMLNFLDRVLPPDGDGQRCWVAIKDKAVRQGFCDTNEQLGVLLRGIDSRQWNAFFACSTFKDGSSRAAENVKSVKAFWFDIDAGKGKPYGDLETARNALGAFADEICLIPPSCLVCSGNGLHAYWILDEPITGEQWLPVAKKLKELTKLHGFDADPSRTADRASILRPTETLNWKDVTAPKEVYILEEGEEISFEEFKRIVLKEQKPLIKDNGLGAAIVGGLGSVRPDMQKGFIDGEGRTHELTKRAGWCLGPDRMTEEQTIEVCLQWNELNTPPIDTEKVIKTVRSLAKREAEKQKENPVHLPPEITDGRNVPELPFPFKSGVGGSIWASKKDPDAEPGEEKYIDVMVSQFPFYIESLRKEETNGVAGNHSVKVTRRTPHSAWESFTVSRRVLLSGEWRSALGAYGVVCEPGTEKVFGTLIHKMILQKENEGMTDISYKSFGWKKDRTGFAAGRRYYEKGKITDISGTAEFEKAADLLSPKPKGSINKWRAAAARVFVAGCEAQALSMLASFASPLMDLLFADDEGGCILSLISSKGGQGKTAAILAAETVWGQTNCLRLTEAASDAARFRAIGVRCNMPVVIDEWGNTDIDKIRDRVAIFTGGLDKSRLAMGGEDTREQLHWKTVMIGTTNLPMVDLLQSANYGAQATRIFEVPVNIPEHLARTQTADLNQELQDNAGFAGPVFLAYLLNNFDLDTLRVKVNALAEEFGRRLQATTEERFKTRLLAGMAMAAAILSNPMINGEPMIEFTPSRPIEYGLNVIKEGRKENSGKKTYLDHLMDFIKDNQHNFVVVEEPYNGRKTYTVHDAVLPKQHLVGRYEQKNKKLFIPSDTMHKFAVSVRLPYREFSKELVNLGVVLNRNRQTHLTAGCVKMTAVRVSCWEIDLSHAAIEDLDCDMDRGLESKKTRKLKSEEAKNRVDDSDDMV